MKEKNVIGDGTHNAGTGAQDVILVSMDNVATAVSAQMFQPNVVMAF
jgi:hypothetical protein